MSGTILPDLRWEALTDRQRELYMRIVSGPRKSRRLSAASEKGDALPGPFGPMLLNPPIGGPLQELGAALRHGGALEPRLREIGILATGAFTRSRYELSAHVPLALDAGVSAREIEDLLEGGNPPSDAAGSAVVRTVSVIFSKGHVPRAEMEELLKCVGNDGAFELLVIVGYYRLLASIIETYGIE